MVTHDSKSDLPLRISQICSFIFQLNQPGGSLWFRISREMFICANLLFVTNHPQRANQIINLQCLEFVEVWLLQTEARAEDLCHIRGASINYVDKLFFFFINNIILTKMHFCFNFAKLVCHSFQKLNICNWIYRKISEKNYLKNSCNKILFCFYQRNLWILLRPLCDTATAA